MIVILMKMNVGFVGLGKMGAPMTRNLLMARNIVNIYNKNLSNIEPLLELGANKQAGNINPSTAASFEVHPDDACPDPELRVDVIDTQPIS